MARKPIEKHLPLPVRHTLKELGMLIKIGRKEKQFAQTKQNWQSAWVLDE